MTLVPTYGRDYRSQKSVQRDFMRDMDFVIQDMSSLWDGKLCNRSGLIKHGIKQVDIRYNGLRSSLAIEVNREY